MTETKRSRFRSLPCLGSLRCHRDLLHAAGRISCIGLISPLQARRANPEKNPIVRRGLKEEVNALFPKGAGNEVILNVAAALAQKELES